MDARDLGKLTPNTKVIAAIQKAIPGTELMGESGWYYLPNCLVCRRKRKMCFNIKVGYKCWSKRCNAHGSINDFIRLMQSKGYKISIYGGIGFSTRLTIAEKHHEIDKKVDIHVPPESIPIIKEDDIPAYLLKARGFKASTILNADMSYCMDGKYAGRLIVPLSTQGSHAFLAYKIMPLIRGPKVKYPFGCPITKFLFSFDLPKGNMPKRLVLVEGVMDAFRVYEHYMTAPDRLPFPLALLGGHLSQHQMWTLFDMVLDGCEEITICLDADTGDHACKIANRMSNITGARVISWMSLMDITKKQLATVRETKPGISAVDLDPDDIRDVAIWSDLYSKRQRLHWTTQIA